MKHTLLNNYMAGETSASEERELKRQLLGKHQDSLTDEEKAVLQLLSYTHTEEEEDIFSVDYSDEYEDAVRPRRNLHIGFWLAAACVAGILFLFLMPPEDGIAEQETPPPVAELVRDTTSNEIPPVRKAVTDEEPEPEIMPRTISQVTTERLIARAEVAEETETDSAEDKELLAVTPATDIQHEEAEILTAQADEVPQEAQETSLTITYPERLKYTPEEMKKLKEIAREKYLEWIQLEQEILNAEMKYLTELIKEQ